MKYTATKAIQLPTGTLVKLDDKKAARHAAELAKRKGGQYECLVPVWVKAGETIDLDAPAKHLLAHLDPLDKAAAKKAAAEADARAKADAEAKALADLEADEAAAADAEARRTADEAAAQQNSQPAE